MPGLLSEALAGLTCYNTSGLAGPFDRIFGRCVLTPEDLGIGKATPARTFGELLVAARSDRSQPGQSLHRIWSIKASSVMVLRGEYPPQPQTTISNSKYVTQILRTLACVNRTVNHGLKAEAPSRYPVDNVDLVIDRLRGL